MMSIELGHYEQDRLMRLFEQSFAHFAPSDVIFWPKRLPVGSWPDPSADEIVDEVLAYRPVELGP